MENSLLPRGGDGFVLTQDYWLGDGTDHACRVVVHSDRGSQYASEAHRALLACHGLIASIID